MPQSLVIPDIEAQVNELLGEITQEQLEHELEIIELQANATLTPLDHDTLISDTFSDADGYLDTVNTGETDATFSTNKYIGNAELNATHGFNQDNNFSSATFNGLRVSFDENVTLNSVSRYPEATSLTRVRVYTTDGTEIGAGTFTADKCTFASPIALSSGVEYWIASNGGGGSITQYRNTSFSAQVDKDCTFIGQVIDAEGVKTLNTNQSINLLDLDYSKASGDAVLVIDLPTISDTAVASALVVNGSIDNSEYALTDGVNTDSNLVIGGEKNDFSTLTSNPTKITITLAEADEIKTYCLKIWKGT